MALEGLLGRIFGKNEKFKEMQENTRFQKLLEQRQKNANERELESFEEEERQKVIKEKLNQFKKMRRTEANKSTILKSNFNILNNSNPILKQENIFSMEKIQSGKNLFFK